MNFILSCKDVTDIEKMIDAEIRPSDLDEKIQKATELCKDLYKKSITPDELSILDTLYNNEKGDYSITLYINVEPDNDIRLNLFDKNDGYAFKIKIDTEYPFFRYGFTIITARMNGLLREVSPEDNHIKRLMETYRDYIKLKRSSKYELKPGKKVSSHSKEVKDFINSHFIDKLRDDFNSFCNIIHQACGYPKMTRRLKDVLCTPRINGILYTGLEYFINQNIKNRKPDNSSLVEWIKEVSNKAYPEKVREVTNNLNLGSEIYKKSIFIVGDGTNIKISNNICDDYRLCLVSCIVYDLCTDNNYHLISDYLTRWLNDELSKDKTVILDYIDRVNQYRKETEILRNPEIIKCIEHTSEIPETLASSILYVSEKLPRPDYFKKIVDEIFE